MDQGRTRGEIHGCIVCGRLHQLYAVYDAAGLFVGAKVMSPGARVVAHPRRALVACETHTEEDIQRAVERVYGTPDLEDE